jgi:hypothetical protein
MDFARRMHAKGGMAFDLNQRAQGSIRGTVTEPISATAARVDVYQSGFRIDR